MNRSRKLYVTGSRPDDGKTAVTLGLLFAFLKRTPKVGFIKPLGKRDVDARGFGLDEDSILIEKACQVHCSLPDMSPVTVDRELTDPYLEQAVSEVLLDRVREAFARVAEDKDVIVIEGTGHAARGSVYGLSNGDVARELGARVVLVSSGPIDQSLDEIALNLSFFQARGVEVLGVILNRARPGDVAFLRNSGRRLLERLGVRLLGIVPQDARLATSTVLQVFEAIGARPLHAAEAKLGARVQRTLIGAMTAAQALGRLEDGALVVTGGDRVDMILAALASRVMSDGPRLAGLILTGGLRPPDPIVALMKRTDLPVAIVDTDTYATARRIDDMPGRIAPNDRLKHDVARALVEEHVDVEAIWEGLS